MSKFGDNTTGCGKAFLCFDVDGEGLISYARFDEGLRRYAGLQFDIQQLKQALSDYDDSNKGGITYENFVNKVGFLLRYIAWANNRIVVVFCSPLCKLCISHSGATKTRDRDGHHAVWAQSMTATLLQLPQWLNV